METATIPHDDASYAGDIPGMRIQHDDASYTGEVSDSRLSVDYWRTRATEFQSTLNALDSAYWAAVNALSAEALGDQTEAVTQLIAEYESKRYTLRLTAEAVNAGAAVINASGGRFPSLSIPAGLAAVPLLLPAAAVAALGAAGALVVWGRQWIVGLNERLMLAQALDAQESPEKRAALAASVVQTENAIKQAESSGFGTLAPILKWGAFAVGAFFVWKAVRGGALDRFID